MMCGLFWWACLSLPVGHTYIKPASVLEMEDPSTMLSGVLVGVRSWGVRSALSWEDGRGGGAWSAFEG